MNGFAYINIAIILFGLILLLAGCNMNYSASIELYDGAYVHIRGN